MRFSTPIRYLFLTLILLSVPTGSFAQFGISVSFGPPAIPVYEQPICPGDGYIWTPGYWAWDGNDYYWVPGTWVLWLRPIAPVAGDVAMLAQEVIPVLKALRSNGLNVVVAIHHQHGRDVAERLLLALLGDRSG